MPPSWLRIAHRGASGSAPEHTRAAFERALELGVDMIELDVQLSRDGELVVIHDLDLERTTSGHGCVRAYDLAHLTALDAGAWFGSGFAGQRLLSLEDVIAIVGARARLNVEVKAPATDWGRLAPKLTSTLRTRGLLASTVISSFETGALAAVRAEAADARIGLLWQTSDFADAWRWAADIGATSFHPHWMLVAPEMVSAAHGHGLQILVWTVNDTVAMRQLLGLGVDGIMSDFPERFAQVSEVGKLSAKT